MVKKQIKYEYHHMGIPTQEKRPGERYSSKFKLYTSDSENSEFHIQWHRFENDCTMHPLIQTMPHVAFIVDSIEKAIKGKKILLEPYYPLEGFRVAFIEDGGVPIEFIETELSWDEIMARTKTKSLLYPDNPDSK